MTRKASVALLLLLGLAGGSSTRVLAEDDGLPAPDARLPASIMTEFDVRRDGMSFGNNGHYTEPDGDCFGMSLLAVKLYVQRAEPWRKREREQAPAIVERVQDPGANVRRAAAAAIIQYQTSAHGDDDRDNAYVAPDAAGPHFVAALRRIAKSGVPEVLNSEDHATVLFGFKDGKLLIYDPNYPGETIEWPFDPKTGLGEHPKADDDEAYGPEIRVSSTPVDKYLAWRDVDWARAGCDTLAEKCMDYFPTITATVTRVEGKAERVEVKGRVTRGLATNGEGDPSVPPEQVWVVVNGVALGDVKIVKGAYRLEVAASAFGAGERDLRVVATVENDDEGALAGFLETKVTLPAAPGEAEAPRRTSTPGFTGALEGAERKP